MVFMGSCTYADLKYRTIWLAQVGYSQCVQKCVTVTSSTSICITCQSKSLIHCGSMITLRSVLYESSLSRQQAGDMNHHEWI